MNEPPKIKVGNRTLNGFGEVDQWAKVCSPVWNKATEMATYYRLDTEQRLKLISTFLLLRMLDLENKEIERFRKQQ